MKLRRVLTVFASLIFIAVLFGCGGGGGGGRGKGSGDDGDGSGSRSPVSVRFGIISENDNYLSIVGDDGVDTSSFRYYYKATPQWGAMERSSIQGNTKGGFVEFTDQYYTGSPVASKFAQGSWKFWIEVREASGTTVLYESKNAGIDASLSSASNNVDVEAEVSRQLNGSNNIAVNIAVPAIAGAKLVITYVPYGEDTPKTYNVVGIPNKKTDAQGNPVDADGWTLFTSGKNDDIPAGIYIFNISYQDVDGNEIAMEGPLPINIMAGAAPTLVGAFNDDEIGPQQVFFVINGVKLFGVKFTNSPAASIARDDADGIEFTVGKLNNSWVDIAAYQWYVEGEPVNGATSSSFTFKPSVHYPYVGDTTVTCIAVSSAQDGSLFASCSKDIAVTE